MSSRASDLVRDSQLNTRFVAGAIQHVYYLSSSTTRRRRIRTEETWRRQRELGNGTFGRVWLEGCVSGSKQGQLRAVKEISKDGASTTIDYGRELEAIAKFSHGNYVHCFVKSYGWYETSDAVFIAMEYLEHGDLQKHLTGPLPEVEAKEISSQLVEGLVFMHDNGFAHRDLKPGNILVLQPGPEWWIKISDFGISKRAEEENTALRTLIGTEGYLAPELKGFQTAEDAAQNDSNHPSYTFAVDIWSLGEIIFRMMSHEAAFRNPRDLFNYVVYNRPFPVEPLRKNSASEDCVDFVIKFTLLIIGEDIRSGCYGG
ncbi:putative calcium calmodulin-dependent protein kinase type 1b protein [Phaeoacremonium minimum UCRPA7]|uniref:non-specific serine/threonine protein kinase n=1 Tax=Phaeoacremonium minimum (strain UCR-PA7) TaxID=1286976 RepID=R8BUF8_PHAM7|nr:putative calcium calmodulin-dependent protein kinase type 1b protein [Phaeoacremonium minimum UCRPA7]EOO03023.1 putative calcium calmodulin-dependent protein kinase type 1b protein [Phaeoacremonium minimum UCRPA7]